MDSPYPQQIDGSGSPEASTSRLPAHAESSEGSWAEDSSSGYETESDYYSAGDEEFWDEDNAAVRWLARNPGGTPYLYPQLFVVNSRRGSRETQPDQLRRGSLFTLPSEIRNRIYTIYFNIGGDDQRREHAGEGYTPFTDREGKEMNRILLTSENQELRFYISTALLQTSRQVRSEAMPILFRERAFTVEWLPALPRLIEFLGIEGCAMVRYLDAYDFLNLQEHDNIAYQDLISSILNFPNLQHLRIVLSWGTLHGEFWTDRIRSWFNSNEWTDGGTLLERAVPKIKSEHIENHWREYDLLKALKAQRFTLAVQADEIDKYLEFDKNHGAYPELTMAMQPAVMTGPSPDSLPSSNTSILPSVLEVFEDTTISAHGTISTPASRSDDQNSYDPSWRDTDELANKTIPMYNQLREFFQVNVLPTLSQEERLAKDFAAFPTALKSTGSVMRDCSMCYLKDGHCGFHSIPDQSPLVTDPERNGAMERDACTSEVRFRDMSYVDMRDACGDLVTWIVEHAQQHDLLRTTFVIEGYIGWYDLRNIELLERLDAAVDAGWIGQKFDKQEVPPWDLLYRELIFEIS